MDSSPCVAGSPSVRMSTNFWNPPVGRMLLSTPWLKVYWPVRAVTLDGQQMDDVTKEFSKVTPWAASSSWTRGMYCIVSTSWSSVMMNTMFGWAAEGTRPVFQDFEPRPAACRRSGASRPVPVAAERISGCAANE